MKIYTRNLKVALMSVLILCLFSGCVDNGTIEDSPGMQNGTDGLVGVIPEETIPEIPERIVSMSPNLTQIIFAMNADDLLVGVDEYSVYPPEAEDIPRMGNYLDPDLESLIAAKPDLVLAVETDEGIGRMLDGLRLEYEVFGNDSIEEIMDSVGRLGILLGHEDEAFEIMNDFVSARTEIIRALEGTETVDVALVVGRNPGRLQDIYVAGRGNFLSELLEIAGGKNVFGDQPIPWPQVGVESLIGADPDVIIDSTLAKGATEGEYEALLEDWDELPDLKAVRNGKIIVARDGWFQIPGAYLDSTLRLFAHWLHPEIFPDEVDDPNE